MNKSTRTSVKPSPIPTLEDINALVATAEARDTVGYTEDAAQQIREGLNAAGWKTVTVSEFLELTPEESALIEVRRSLARALQQRRRAGGMTQTELAKRIGSSQSRIAYVELGHPSVSLDLMVRAFLATGADQNDLARAIAI